MPTMSVHRRILSLWLPRAGAERLARRMSTTADAPIILAVVQEEKNALRIVSATAAAEAAGVRLGLTLADARAICPELRTAPHDAHAEERFLAGLRRWALRYAPWVGADGADGIALDITGCAHLFGGEAALMSDMLSRLEGLGFTARAAVADAKGAAWALARFGKSSELAARHDTLEHDTHQHGAFRHDTLQPGAIAPPGETRRALADLPPEALRLPPKTVETFARLGLRRIDQLLAQPRAGLARRFGAETLRRLDQAIGAEPEPVSPAAPPPIYAVRFSLPEPIGALDDVRAGLERLLGRLTERLASDAVGARTLRLTIRRVDRDEQSIEVSLARPSRDPARIRPLFEQGLERLDAGFGIDALRLQATVVEPLGARQTHAGPDLTDRRAPLAVSATGGAPHQTADAVRDPEAAMADLIGRLGVRLGVDAVTRLSPAESHAPEKAAITTPAAYSEPATNWLAHAAQRPPRPLTRLRPEPVEPLPSPIALSQTASSPVASSPAVSSPVASSPAASSPCAPPSPTAAGHAPSHSPSDAPAREAPSEQATAGARPPRQFRWRGRTHRLAHAAGPERIAPEWWLDDPNWRSGLRDYWRVETEEGLRLWLFHTPQAHRHMGPHAPLWFAAGIFA